MAKENTILIPRKPGPKISKEAFTSLKSHYILFAMVFGGYLALLGLLTFLQLDFSIKILALLVGSFILIDLHKTLAKHLYA